MARVIKTGKNDVQVPLWRAACLEFIETYER